MSKKGAGGRPGDDILNELTSVSSLLGEAGKDVDPEGMDDGVPVLEPEGGDSGDAHTQIPLLGGDDDASRGAARDLKKELAARENPFLPHKQIDALKKSRQQAGDALTGKAPAPAANSSAPAKPAADSKITDDQVKQTVDALLAEWMPRLEKELRERLTRLLKS